VRKTVLCTCIAVAFATNLPAAAIFGAFNFNGSVTVTQNTITWKSDGGVTDKATMGSTGLTGSFALLGGTTLTILDLNRATEPVGVTFAAQPFMSFDAAPSLGGLNVNFIALGSFPSTQCHNPTPAPGQVCTLSSADVPGGSPFMFTNTASDGTHVDGSTAQFTMRGITSDGLSQWNGVWTAQFLESYQDVFATFFGPTGAVTNSYSAAAQVNVVPEPDSTILLGVGLMAISFGVRKFRRA
jgi:hypothetical protein